MTQKERKQQTEYLLKVNTTITKGLIEFNNYNFLRFVLDKAFYNGLRRSDVAKYLGISRFTLYQRIDNIGQLTPKQLQILTIICQEDEIEYARSTIRAIEERNKVINDFYNSRNKGK